MESEIKSAIVPNKDLIVNLYTMKKNLKTKIKFYEKSKQIFMLIRY